MPATPSNRRLGCRLFLPVPHIPQRSVRVAPSLRHCPCHQVRRWLQRCESSSLSVRTINNK
nr:MAG TPA: hypothetical protein [Caudoviricetes sp.]